MKTLVDHPDPDSNETLRPLVIYHADCDDGLTAAWAIRDHFRWAKKSVELHPAKYQTPPPDVTDRVVIMVDFSYKRPVLLEMASVARNILILDHHKSAQEDLQGLSLPNLKVVFDMERSGAGIAWDHFFGKRPRPWFIDYVEDNDLWRHKLPDCKAIMEFLRSIRPADRMMYYDEETNMNGPDDRAHVHLGAKVSAGNHILRAKQIMVEQTMSHAHFVDLPVPLTIATTETGEKYGTGEWRRMYASNVPFFLSSEVDHALVEKNLKECGLAVGVTYYRQKDGRYSLSFRSDRHNGDYDVSKIALQFGGGGHRNAAGATVETLPWDDSPMWRLTRLPDGSTETKRLS